MTLLRTGQQVESIEHSQSSEPASQHLGGVFWKRIRSALRVLSSGAHELLGLVVPLNCAGCGASDVAVCTSCQSSLLSQLIPVPDMEFPVVAAHPYAGSLRTLLVQWKDHGRADMSEWIIAASAMAGVRCGTRMTSSTSCSLVAEIVIVPMPSSRGATTRRQFVPAQLIAQGLTLGLQDSLVRAHRACTHETRLHLVDALRMTHKRKDQVGLGRVDRRRNALGSMQLSEKQAAWLNRASLVLIVDDIVTTGSTMNEARRLITALTGTNVRGFALSYTPRS